MSLDKAELCDSLLTWVSSASFPSQANCRARWLTGDRQQVLAEELFRYGVKSMQNADLGRIASHCCLLLGG